MEGRRLKIGRRANGFTLLEVLIAVALTALVGVIAYGFLNTAMRAYSGHAESAKRLDELNVFFSLLSRDVSQLVDRPIRDENGDEKGALEGGLSSEYLLTFTRGGWPNPRELPRSDLQRVAYGLNDDRLERITWPVIDRVNNDNVFKSVALEGVNNVAIRFLKADQVIVDDDRVASDWEESWPANSNQGIPVQSAQSDMPVALEFTVELEGWGELRRVFALDLES